MWTNKLTSALLLSLLLAGCSKPPPEPEAVPPPAPATESQPPAPTVPPEDAPAAPAQPAPDAPPPTEPSAAPKPTAAADPSLDSMRVAAPNAKMSVAAELRYQFDGAALPNQPVTLHLAAVPRAAGSMVSVSVKQAAGLDIVGGDMRQQKTQGKEVWRKQFSVTRSANSPAELRVLVTMESSAGSSFGFFSVPFDSGTNPQK